MKSDIKYYVNLPKINNKKNSRERKKTILTT